MVIDTIGTNSGAPDLLDHLREPERWVTPSCRSMDLDWWHFVSDVDQQTPTLRSWLGPNTYQAINDVGLASVPRLIISGEACKEHDPDGSKNERKWLDVVLPRVWQAGGTVAAITLDEPVTSTIPGRYRPPGREYPYTLDDLPRVVDHTRRLTQRIRLPFVLYEAWPQHSAETLEREIRWLAEATKLCQRFVLDVDVRAILPRDDLAWTIDFLQATCTEHGIEFAVCGHAQHGPHDGILSYILSLRDWLTTIPDGVTVATAESWNEWEGRKEIPTCNALASVLPDYTEEEPPMPDNPTPDDLGRWCRETREDQADYHGVPPRDLDNIHGVGAWAWHRTPWGGSKDRAWVAERYAAKQDKQKPPPPPPPSALPPITVNGRGFEVHAAPFDWREITSFMLLERTRKGENVRGRLHTVRGLGHNMVRVLGAVRHPFWGRWRFGPESVGYYEAMERLFQLTAEEGLYLRICLIADEHIVDRGQANRKEHVRMVAELAHRYPHVIGEVWNEPAGWHYFKTGEVAELRELARVWKSEAPNNLIALGAEYEQFGHLPTYDLEPADYVAFHVHRKMEHDGWNWLKRLMQDYGVVAHGVRPVVCGETPKPGDQYGGANPAIWWAYGVASRLTDGFGFAPTFHYHDGLFSVKPEGLDEVCSRAFLSGCDAAPLSARAMPFVNGHWVDSPFIGYSQTDPPSDDRPFRIYGRGGEGNYWGLAIRHRQGWAPTQVRYMVNRVVEYVGGSDGWCASLWRG